MASGTTPTRFLTLTLDQATEITDKQKKVLTAFAERSELEELSKFGEFSECFQLEQCVQKVALPVFEMQIKILTYSDRQQKACSCTFFVVKPATAQASDALPWYEPAGVLALGVEALKTLTPALKARSFSWPVLVQAKTSSYYAGGLAKNAAQLIEEKQTHSLEESIKDEEGKKILFGKHLAFGWLKAWDTATQEDQKALQDSVKALFRLFCQMPEGALSFTAKEFAPFQTKMNLSPDLLKDLRWNQMIPSEQEMKEVLPKTLPTPRSSISTSTSTTAQSSARLPSSVPTSSIPRGPTDNPRPKASGSFVIKAMVAVLVIAGGLFTLSKVKQWLWQKR